MITFVDGPAKGHTLRLRRSPLMLRVVRDRRTGAIDALDQPDDTVKASEDVFVYQLTRKPSWMHVRCSRRSDGGFFAIAEYSCLHFLAITEQELRDNALWAAWCDRNAESLMPDWWKDLEREQAARKRED